MENGDLVCGCAEFLLCPCTLEQRLHGVVVPCGQPLLPGGVVGIAVTKQTVMLV